MNRRSEPVGPVGDRVLVALLAAGLVLAVGLTGDLTRHVLDPPEIPDGVFDGWHAVIDAGIIAVGLVLTATVLTGGRRRIRDLLPAHLGFLIAALGLVLLVAWHRQVGVENRIDALVSPPHLVLVAGLVLVLVTPIVVVDRRSTLRGDRRLGWGASAIVWTAATALLVAANLLTGHSSALTGGVSFDLGHLESVIGRGTTEFELARGLTMILWFSTTIGLSQTVLLRRFRPRPGFVLAGFGVLAATVVLIDATDGARPLALGLLAAGLTAEAAVSIHGRPVLGAVTAPLLVGVATLALWSVTFLVLDLDDLLRWTMPSVLGSTLLAVLAAVGSAVLVGVGRPPIRMPAADPTITPGERARTPRFETEVSADDVRSGEDERPESDRGTAPAESRRVRSRRTERTDRPIDRLLAEFDEDDDIFTPRFSPSPPPGRPADRRRGGREPGDRRIDP